MENLKKLLKELGLTDEQIDKVLKEGINDKFIPKFRFDEVNEKNKQLTDDISARDKQIKELSKFEGDNASLKTKIEELEKANKEKDEENQKAIKQLKIDNAVDFALNGKVQEGYNDIVRGLIDKQLIVLKDDGTVSGLDEQIEKIKKDKALLFVTDNGDNGDGKKPDGWNFKGGDPSEGQRQNTKSVSENFVNSLLADNKTISESTKNASDYYFGTK